ncbi:hypothetical protein [Saccharopolyspora sp. NPDC049426]|uniref:hypothetical protein n=1 Tax=Saccharopolyspora sp. NPDC049426 TaxID=3155652 RepID=UPI00341B4157
MTELLEAVVSWHNLLMVLLVFGFAPGFVLRLLVRIYPKDDPRRDEHLAAFYAHSRVERPLFVADLLAAGLTDALPSRLRALRARLRSPSTLAASEPVGIRFISNVIEGSVIHHGRIYVWDGRAETECGKELSHGAYRESKKFLMTDANCTNCARVRQGSR